jgi:hypothetical protein
MEAAVILFQRPIETLPWLVLQKPMISRLLLYFLSVKPLANNLYVPVHREGVLLEQKTVMLDDAV